MSRFLEIQRRYDSACLCYPGTVCARCAAMEVDMSHLLDLLDALYDACKVDQPDEGKHEALRRLMWMIRP